MNYKRPLVGILVIIAILAAGSLYLGYPVGQVMNAPEEAKSDLDAAVILLSGDGGARTGMAPAVSARLRNAGIPVVLVRSLTFFSRHRSDAEVSNMLHEAMDLGKRKYGATRFIMVGQSFGADVLPTGLAGLARTDRSRIAGAILIVPSREILYHATPFGLFNWGDRGIDARPAARTLTWLPVACIRGAEENHSLCTELNLPGMVSRALPGGHYMHHDDAALFAAILPIINANLTKASSTDHAPARLTTPQRHQAIR